MLTDASPGTLAVDRLTLHLHQAEMGDDLSISKSATTFHKEDATNFSFNIAYRD